MISLVVTILVLVLVIWAAGQLLPLAHLPAPIHTVLYVLIVVVAIIWAIQRHAGGINLTSN